MPLLYLNVYLVTRHYGGPEEGGWWYNRGEAVASMPVKARIEKGHKGECERCRRARLGLTDMCKDYPEDWDERTKLAADVVHAQLGTSLSLQEWEDLEARVVAQLEAQLPEVTHLMPENGWAAEEERVRLCNLFADQAEGNIYSVHGGVEVSVVMEEHMARNWPEEIPKYE